MLMIGIVGTGRNNEIAVPLITYGAIREYVPLRPCASTLDYL
jgi:hypothetical protein